MSNCYTVHADDIQALLKYFSSDAEKTALIKYFLPEMSYADAIQLKLIDQAHARKCIIDDMRRMNPNFAHPTTIDAATGNSITPSPGSVRNELDDLFSNEDVYDYFFLKLEGVHGDRLTGISDEEQKKLFHQVVKEINE